MFERATVHVRAACCRSLPPTKAANTIATLRDLPDPSTALLGNDTVSPLSIPSGRPHARLGENKFGHYARLCFLNVIYNDKNRYACTHLDDSTHAFVK